MAFLSTISLFALLLLSLSGLLRARDVEVEIVAPWKEFSTNLLPQIAEHLRAVPSAVATAKHGQVRAHGAVWDFIDKLCLSPEVVDNFVWKSNASSSLFHEHLRSSWQSVVPASLHSITETMLALGSYAAAVPFYYNLAPRSSGCAAGLPVLVLQPGHRVLCDPTAQDLLLAHASASENESAEEEVQDEDWDLVYSTTASPKTRRAELYGVWGSSAFCQQFYRLVESVQEGGPIASFSVRHLFEEVAEVGAVTSLTAFGAFLDIKNMEYKNVDDSSSSSSAAASEEQGGSASFSTEEVAGINFQAVFNSLSASLPDDEDREKQLTELRKDLTALREELLLRDVSSSSDAQEQLPLKTWQLANLGLQTVQYFLSMQAKTSPALALGRLAQIIKELPAHAALLAHLRVSHAVRQGVDAWYQGLAGGEARSLSGSPPAGTLFVNNRPVALGEANFNLHEAMEIVFEEALALQRLRALPLKKKQQNALQELALRGPTVQPQETEVSLN